VVGAAFTVGALTLAGLPPLSLWVTKDEVLAAALHQGAALYATGLAAAVVSAVYSIKALWYVWQPAPAGAASGYDTERAGTRRVAPETAPPLIVLAVAAATLGVLAVPALAGPLTRALGAAGEPSSAWWQLALSALLAAAASALAWWRGAAGIGVPAAVTGWLARWMDLERAAVLLIVRPVLALAGFLATFDDQVLDRAVLGLARGTVVLARAAARFDDGGIDEVVSAVAAGARRLGQLARRPQTGQVYAYYAQAAVAFAVLALVLIFVR
jgi:NADH:ubiquinone oxidoreductase subunit 5 (subunit L)/multisubunit Na+/H+ antiporter MnhA subunit